MKEVNKLTQAVRLALFASVLTVPAVATAADTTDVEVKAAQTIKFQAESQDDGLGEELDEEMEQITVTGSRIRRAEFSSASPIQVVNGEISRELGVFGAADMLQSTSQAAGQQIDNSFGGFVLDNGPGSETISFRGLGANRTLALVNGKRMVSSGAGGAPAAADLSLVPSVMIDRIENLFDGASTVYGSDAVAGVANVILKKDVEGFEFEASHSQPKGSGGEKSSLSGMYGKTYDNGFFSIGAEYKNEEAQAVGENRFTAGCDQFIYETRDGRRLNQNRTTGPTAEGFGECDIFPLTNRVFFGDTLWGSLYRTPGSTNTGIPNFSETTVGFDAAFHPFWYDGDSNGDGINDNVFVDGDGDGFRDVSFNDPFYNYTLSDYARSGDLTNKLERINVIANGEYNFQDENDTTAYFEGMYAQRNSDGFNPGGQIFPEISASNPFNPCGNGNGALCGGGLVDWGPSTATPIINIRGDRDRAKTDVSQYRLVAGITGNIAALDNVGGGNWYYDAYASFASSTGENSIQGIHATRLRHSLDTTVLNDDGSYSCGDGSDGCVPVNLFADNIYQLGGGTFTDAEAEYLFVDRTIETNIDQFVVNGFIGGDAFSLPWNDEVVSGILGLEYRKDTIGTNANDVATEGLLQSYFVDKGAKGSRDIKEIFAEVELPLLRGQEYAEELTVSIAGRVTKEEFSDTHSTYSLKAVYRPVEWLTLRGTKGTSFRAPDLRERFILGTSGFNDVSDSCVVPDLARGTVDPLDINSDETYDASGDTREQYILDSCLANGADPFSLGLRANGNDSLTSSYSTEIETSGTNNLEPETSLSKTWGVIFEQPFSEDFELTLGVTHFDIEITNSIAEPSHAYVFDQCYDNREQPNGESAFCDLVTRGDDSTVDLITPGFINIGFESAVGFDYNIYYQQDFLIGDENLGVSLDITATKMTEQAFDILGSFDDNVGEVTTPEWRGDAHLALSYQDFTLHWQAKFIGGGAFDEEDRDDWSSEYDACTGLIENGEPVECRPIQETDNYIVHTASLNWEVDNYGITLGVKNVFDTKPELVDADKGQFNYRNIPLGVGYDFQGRTVFLNFAMKL